MRLQVSQRPLERRRLAAALSVLVDGGRLATITSDPPSAERGIRVSNVYVRPDGIELQRLAELLGKNELTFTVASSSRLADAGAALAAGKVSGAAVVVP